MPARTSGRVRLLWALLGLCLTCAGCCHPFALCEPPPADDRQPRELSKVSLPSYVIEPPDILQIDALRVVPLPPYRVEPLDGLMIQVAGTSPEDPISGIFTIAPEGTINLGPYYGVVRVAGQTIEDVQQSLNRHLKQILKAPRVVVALAQFRGMQQIRGEHLVRLDGTISLGIYGCVYVTGMTLSQAKAAIEDHLSQFLLNPEVSVDVSGYNSKVYYIVIDGAGYGQQIIRLPVTGNETVLDAIGAINGLPAVASTRRIWVARPSPSEVCEDQILPVDWHGITDGCTATNYQILPGDRIHIKSDSLINLDNALAKIISPVERLFGITLLGNVTVRSFRNNSGNGSGGGGTGF
jgi:protein involved in polysaccharide export with SLBB domain